MYDEAFLARIEGGLRSALPHWDVPSKTDVQLLNISENMTFRASGTGMVFRVHRPGYHSKAEILSELAWIEALRADAIVVTPEPIPLRNGELVAEIDDRGETRHVVAFAFVPGHEPAEDADLAGWFHELGVIHARLHAHAKRWQRPAHFSRKTWNFATTLGGSPLWGDWRAALGLSPPGRKVLERAVAALEQDLAAIGEGPEDFGLIHADLRLANLLVDERRLALIDFDDCGFCWYLYDFAAAVSFLEHQPYVPALQAAWVEGYRSLAPLNDERAAQIPLFVMLRRLLLTAWVASHAETPTAQSMGIPYTEGTVALADAFLAGRG